MAETEPMRDVVAETIDFIRARDAEGAISLNLSMQRLINLADAANRRPPDPAVAATTDPDAGAKILADFIGLAWDGLTPDARPKGYPMWAYNGVGRLTYQGGAAGLREVAAAITQAGDPAVAELVEALKAVTADLYEFHSFCDDTKRPCGEYGRECPISMGEWLGESERAMLAHVRALLAKHAAKP